MNKNIIIAINDDYRIEVDSYNYILQKHKTEKLDSSTKEMIMCDIWTDIGYYGNVYMCLYKLINDVEIKPDRHISVLVERMEEMFEELKKVGEQIEKRR